MGALNERGIKTGQGKPRAFSDGETHMDAQKYAAEAIGTFWLTFAGMWQRRDRIRLSGGRHRPRRRVAGVETCHRGVGLEIRDGGDL